MDPAAMARCSRVKSPCFRTASMEGRIVMVFCPSVVSLHFLTEELHVPGHTICWRRRVREAHWSLRHSFTSSFPLDMTRFTAWQPKNPSVESRQYWPLNVPRVSSGSLATRSQGLPSPSSRRSCVHSVSLVSIRPWVPGSQYPQWLLWTAGTQAESIWYPNSGRFCLTFKATVMLAP